MTNLMNSMQKQCKMLERGELIREGLQIARSLLAGKSSLFNLLAAGTLPLSLPAGTTRDILEVSLNRAASSAWIQDTGVRTSSKT
jgi:tRNA U34 5-carboxymethylaminomethyl modifying GTPase MnmE/TrmE